MAEAVHDRVAIRIGEKVFHTTKTTLSESVLLTSMLAASAEQDEYFVDADPELFEHVLRYLRTKIFPIFFDKAKGHDMFMYLALQRQAKFYQIDKLDAWIGSKKYQDAVKRRTTFVTKTFYGEKQIADMRERGASYDELTVVKLVDDVRKCHKCPRKQWSHDGDREACLKAECMMYMKMPPVEMPVRELEIIISSVEIREEICMPIVSEPLNPPAYHTVW